MNRKIALTVLLAALAMPAAAPIGAADLNASAVTYVLPANIQWKDNAAGTNATYVLYGDPSKAEPYAMLLKWKPGNMSRPHFHPNDRFFVVVKGTWWVGTGTKFDPDSTHPVPAGGVVTHFAKGIHYDGAKGEEAIIALHGMGPATSIPAEVK